MWRKTDFLQIQAGIKNSLRDHPASAPGRKFHSFQFAALPVTLCTDLLKTVRQYCCPQTPVPCECSFFDLYQCIRKSDLFLKLASLKCLLADHATGSGKRYTVYLAIIKEAFVPYVSVLIRNLPRCAYSPVSLILYRVYPCIIPQLIPAFFRILSFHGFSALSFSL